MWYVESERNDGRQFKCCVSGRQDQGFDVYAEAASGHWLDSPHNGWHLTVMDSKAVTPAPGRAFHRSRVPGMRFVRILENGGATADNRMMRIAEPIRKTRRQTQPTDGSLRPFARPGFGGWSRLRPRRRPDNPNTPGFLRGIASSPWFVAQADPHTMSSNSRCSRSIHDLETT